MSTQIDITKDVRFGDNDGELLPILKCKCGETFDYWNHAISIYKDNPTECPNCKRMLYFQRSIQVFEVIEEREME